jgi:UDP-glucose 4-epimerase/UDP-glucuronate decarboxylase
MSCQLDCCELVHVGVDEEISIKKLLDKILKVTGFQPTIQSLPAPDGAVSRRCPDVSKLRRLTGFEPGVPLDTGLSLTWDWYGRDREPNISNRNLSSSLHE